MEVAENQPVVVHAASPLQNAMVVLSYQRLPVRLHVQRLQAN